MCTYNISLNDELVRQTRQSFASESLMTSWIQQQLEVVLTDFNARQQAARQKARLAIEAMRRQSEQNGNAGMTLNDINEGEQNGNAGMTLNDINEEILHAFVI